MNPRLLTPQQAQIALLIADPRSLSYEQIGKELSPRLTKRTVKAYVRQMSELFDVDSRQAFPPREHILVWVRQLWWELKRAPTIEEIITASAHRHV